MKSVRTFLEIRNTDTHRDRRGSFRPMYIDGKINEIHRRRNLGGPSLIGATNVGTGGDWSPTFRLGTNNVLEPQLLDRGFQKTRYFVASIVS